MGSPRAYPLMPKLIRWALLAWTGSEAKVNACLAHDAVGSVAGVAIGGYGLVVQTIRPYLMRTGLPQERVTMRLKLLDYQFVITVHTGTALCQMKSV